MKHEHLILATWAVLALIAIMLIHTYFEDKRRIRLADALKTNAALNAELNGLRAASDAAEKTNKALLWNLTQYTVMELEFQLAILDADDPKRPLYEFMRDNPYPSDIDKAKFKELVNETERMTSQKSINGVW